MVKYLLQHGAFVNAVTDIQLHCKTPLHFAATHRDWTIVKSLLAHGANPLLEDMDGNPAIPMEEAQRRGEVQVVQEIRKCRYHNAGADGVFFFLFFFSFSFSLSEW